MRIIAVVLASLLAGPAFASFRCPAKGGAPWREYRSAHFLVDTDVAQGHAGTLVRELERLHALLLQALVGEQVEIPGRVRVLAFADQTDFRDLAGADFVAGYYGRGEFGEPTIVLPVRALSSDPETVAHELSHHLSFFLFPVQPHWFTEGLAEWVQTVAARPGETPTFATGSHIARGTRAMTGSMAGSVPVNLVSWIGYDDRPMPAKELLAWSGEVRESSAGRGHLWSWLLYHWLWNQRGKAFSDYQKRLGESGDPEGAWRAAFPEFDPSNPEAMAKLDAELDRYRRGGRFAFYKVQAEGDGRFSEAPISSSDLHLLLLGMRRSWPGELEKQKALRRAVLDEALAEDTASPSAQYALAKLFDKVDVNALRDAVKARPNDWRGWLALGEVAPAAEKETALRKAVELNPLSAAACNALAWQLVTSDRAKEALPLANRALDLAPWDANIVDTLAEIAARLGRCAEALQLEKRAVATGANDGLRKRAAEIEQRCRAPGK
jgi:tetratricopeptide (TPR) repeat protein